jgi:hypothetical protein
MGERNAAVLSLPPAERRQVVLVAAAAATPWGLGTAAAAARWMDNLGAAPPSWRLSAWDADDPLAVQLERASRSTHPPTLRTLAALQHDLSGRLEALPADLRASCSVTLGNGSGHFEAYRNYHRCGIEHGPERLNPVDYPATLANFTAAQICNVFGLTGANATLCGSPLCGSEAVAAAALRLLAGGDRLALAGGVELQNDWSRATAEPWAAAAEGAALLLLQRRQPAAGEVVWRASVSSSPTGPEPPEDRACRLAAALQRLLRAAGVSPQRIDGWFLAAELRQFAEVLRQLGTAPARQPVFWLGAAFGNGGASRGPLLCIAAQQALNCQTPVTKPAAAGGQLWLPRRLGRVRQAVVVDISAGHLAATLWQRSRIAGG